MIKSLFFSRIIYILSVSFLSIIINYLVAILFSFRRRFFDRFLRFQSLKIFDSLLEAYELLFLFYDRFCSISNLLFHDFFSFSFDSISFRIVNLR